jgi:hypothetical protein
MFQGLWITPRECGESRACRREGEEKAANALTPETRLSIDRGPP